MIIRPANEQDITQITQIYSHHVLNGTGTFEIDPPSEQDMQARWQDVCSKKLPYLVLEDDGQIMGFAYCNWFKPRPAYRFSAEDSIYMHADSVGKGMGRLLMSELLAQAQRAGIRKLIAVIGDTANAGSIGLHNAMGFVHVGTIGACGWKFDQWLDVVLMEKALGDGANSSPV